MIMLYAKTIESSNLYYRKSFGRLTVKKENITDVNFEERASDEQYGIISVKERRFGYFIRLKENKNFSTVAEFFEYIRDYYEICFETKEIPIKKEIKTGDVFHNNGKYFLVLGTEISHVHGIIQREIYFDITSITKDEIIKHWQNVGNLENDAENIIAGYKNFYNFIKEKEKER